jgi:alpha-mannosidase
MSENQESIPRQPLVYTFGNHMHWVDMEWLWGYHVLPGSVRDMLTLCRETGAKGNVNFDGIGYEKLAAENPDALQELRAAVQSGTVEIVGTSYGQPYGQFHGGESNVRQRVYGVRAVRRLFGVSPTTFWEEEFDFFPQLPQILAGVGIKHASLFFQWTWHTPEVPYEESPAVRWVGQDGTTLVAATRNRLNLHQWPEDVDILLGEIAEHTSPPSAPAAPPLIQQWLELMPSPDWMCRSEVLLPRLKQLLADERFAIECNTLGEYLSRLDPNSLPERAYRADQVFHGMTLGKNADNMRRRSRNIEEWITAAETLATAVGAFGRPYAQWDVYPTWELEEAWRELLQAQHHDNDECEGLCGHIGKISYDRAQSHAWGVTEAQTTRLEKTFEGHLAFNPLGWPVPFQASGGLVVLPPCGWAPLPRSEPGSDAITIELDSETSDHTYANSSVRMDDEGVVHLDGIIRAELFRLRMTVDGQPRTFSYPKAPNPSNVYLKRRLTSDFGGDVETRVFPAGARPEVIPITISINHLPRLDGGLNAALQAEIKLDRPFRIIADQPYGVAEIDPRGSYRKKYPTGDWMTSRQWFETVKRPFQSLSFVDLVAEDGSGLLILHDGSQQWFADDDGVRVVLSAYDPWDEDRFALTGECNFRVIPHRGLTNADRWRLSQEFTRPPILIEGKGDQPAEPFSLVACDAPGVAITAVYRETSSPLPSGGEGTGVREELAYPTFVRLVELNGQEAHANLTFGATVASAWRTNLLGEPTKDPCDHDARQLRTTLRPFEIATVCVDLVEARKQIRDLDAKREVWATVHRQ